MRKSGILAISLLAVFVLLVGVGVVACDGNGDGNGAPPPGDEEEPIGQLHFTSADGLIEISLDGVERTKVLLHYEEWGEPVSAEGCDFVVVDMTFVRIDDGHVQFGSGSRPIIVGDDGVEYQESYGAWDIYINDPAFVTSAESKLGATATLAFELPEGVQPVRLELTYLFFESWSESWEPVGEEEGYIDIIFP